jgi:hypothetical protein
MTALPNGAVTGRTVDSRDQLQKALIERYAISNQQIPDVSPTATIFRLNWGYWQELLIEFGFV